MTTDMAAHCRQMAADYLARADKTAGMVAKYPGASENAKWQRSEKADRKRADQMLRRAENLDAKSEDISRVIA